MPIDESTPRSRSERTDRKLKLIYLMGFGRSGSTLLANILGEFNGFLSVGEIRSIWEWGFLQNRACGCGKPFLDCEFWKGVSEQISKRAGAIQAERWNRLCLAETRTRDTLKFSLSRGKLPPPRGLREYLAITDTVYAAVRESSGCRVVVDSSKFPFYGRLLGEIRGLELYILHLIRDPRAATYSWSVPQPQPGAPMRRMGTLESSILWNLWNVSTEGLQAPDRKRYLRIRYEDFVLRPRAAVDDILAWVDEHPANSPFSAEDAVRLGTNHTLKGNPCRFKTGLVPLAEDIRWKTEMNPRERRITEILTRPIARRYGYVY
jgi:hypothetical protein